MMMMMAVERSLSWLSSAEVTEVAEVAEARVRARGWWCCGHAGRGNARMLLEVRVLVAAVFCCVVVATVLG